MERKPGRQTFTLDLYTRVCLSVIGVLMAALIVGLWADKAPSPADLRANEALWDSSAQREALVRAQQETNTKLDELMKLLESGRVRVQLMQEQPPPAGAQDAQPGKRK